MTEENIKRMALEAGFSDGEVDYIQSIIIHFATLVAQHERDRMCEQCKWGNHENTTHNETN
jgi:hypothetical protein